MLGDWTIGYIWKQWPERSAIYPQFVDAPPEIRDDSDIAKEYAREGVRIPGWTYPITMWRERPKFTLPAAQPVVTLAQSDALRALCSFDMRAPRC